MRHWALNKRLIVFAKGQMTGVIRTELHVSVDTMHGTEELCGTLFAVTSSSSTSIENGNRSSRTYCFVVHSMLRSTGSTGLCLRSPLLLGGRNHTCSGTKHKVGHCEMYVVSCFSYFITSSNTIYRFVCRAEQHQQQPPCGYNM